MGFVEYLRARHALLVYAIVVGAVVAFITGSVDYGIHNARHCTDSGRLCVPMHVSLAGGTSKILLGIVLGSASFVTMILATTLAASLNKENGRGGFAFTKPLARERVALTYMGIDFVTILIAYAYTVAVCFAALAVLGIAGKVVADPNAAPIAAGGLGAATMWYGLIQVATALRISGGGLVIGLSWPLFILARGAYSIGFFGAGFHAVVAALDHLNPLAYFAFTGHPDEVHLVSLFGYSATTCIAATWIIAIVACVVAIGEWKQLEV
jgi:hypothetical protein